MSGESREEFELDRFGTAGPTMRAELKRGDEVLVRAKVVDPAIKTAYRTAEVEFVHGGTKPAYVDLRDVESAALSRESAQAKRTDEELLCKCGHLYHDHGRNYDAQTRRFSFTYHGPCTKCECQRYQELVRA